MDTRRETVTRYPILLVHGIVLKDFLFFKAFGRIEKMLRAAGYTVYTSRIDGFGTTRTNARQLRDEVESILTGTGAERLNIIAHSKGGLDSKRMIEEYDMADKVASLTTLCTPHKGSPVATGILKLPRWILAIINFWLNFWYRIFGDKQPRALAVCEELALIESVEAEIAHLPAGVYCQSFSTTLEKSRDDFVMGIPLLFSHYWEQDKESDGLVSAESARFGHYRGECTDGSVSHSEIVDFMVKKKKREKIYAFYTDLCADLADRGF